MELSSYIKERREKSAYTQVQLASALGVTQQAISKWESKSKHIVPDFQFWGRLYDLIGCDIPGFLGIGVSYVKEGDVRVV